MVGLGNFAHCIATSGEVLIAVLTHHAAWSAYPRWFLPAVAGNICGGVGMVTILEYGQVIIGGDGELKDDQPRTIEARAEGPGHVADDLRITPVATES